MILTLPEVKLHLRADNADEDALITTYIGAAERSAADFLNREVYADQAAMDAAGDTTGVIITDAIRAACLLIVGHLYNNREAVTADGSPNVLPMGVESLLWPYRVGLGI